jgi:hypothetical protein
MMVRLSTRIRSLVACLALASCAVLASPVRSAAQLDCTNRNCNVDFLFVIDNSVSMGTHQSALAEAAEEMAAQLDSDSIDWRVAVAYTDLRAGDVAGQGGTCVGAAGPGSHVLCPFTRDMHVFRDGADGCAYANPGVCGGGAERGFSAARAALTRLGAGTGCEVVPGGECNLRPDANLVLIFVTDTGEQTTSGPLPGDDDTVEAWASYFAAQGVQVVHGIDCPFNPTPEDPAPCGDKDVDAESYERYRTMIAAFMGVEASILDSDFADAMRVIINAPQNTGTTTTAQPIPTTTSTSTTTTSTAQTGGGSTSTTTIPAGGTTTSTTTVGGSTTSTTTLGGGTTSTTTVGGASTSTTTIGGPTTSTTTVGASTTSTTVSPGGSTTTTVTSPAGSTTTTTLQPTDVSCTFGDDSPCRDDDACTIDTCSIGGRCQHQDASGFDALTCRLPPSVCGELPARAMRRVQAARRLIEQAASVPSARKTHQLVAKAARSLRRASSVASRRARKGKLSAQCAGELRLVVLQTRSYLQR